MAARIVNPSQNSSENFTNALHDLENTEENNMLSVSKNYILLLFVRYI